MLIQTSNYSLAEVQLIGESLLTSFVSLAQTIPSEQATKMSVLEEDIERALDRELFHGI